MSELPAGTVTLLFSDIEGSTPLLSRLGPMYADALDGQRRVLRKAWVGHGGTELGTEGDSFYVVFPTAEGAVSAATQAQRELAAFDWPAGVRVRVRIGVHTGAPTPHDGAYVGMDVHRAARIAGAAHGGQVLVSQATAGLVSRCLPEGVGLNDLGAHKLKDIPAPERLSQLVIGGLQTQFPPVKTLGAASSLPRPSTPLVGRDGELAELTALMGSPGVRLVTLTGPGGSGKTRLAIALARGLVERFPDGVYFVPLAAVTTPAVMWTSIAEVLDAPPEGSTPPGLFDHVAHRAALFVVDNLEQIQGADTVVAELLDHAPEAVAIATTRKPLTLEAEHVHPVPPLELPTDDTIGQAQASGAVQLFVLFAQKVKPGFRLTVDNIRHVVEVCRRLDGLPLAIELAAARIRLLSPKALLSRLDTALDLAAGGHQKPSRQQTLRDTIAWSYDLLNPTQQAFFRRLGVFAGSAELAAVAAVNSDTDPLDLVADLVDASLVTISEDVDGEPRVGMLETIRSYAHDQLTAADELDEVRERHTRHFLEVAEHLCPLMVGDDQVAARARFEVDHDNFRQVLEWALPTDETVTVDEEQVQIGLRLCIALGAFWLGSGYLAEWRGWLQRGCWRGRSMTSPELARCLQSLSFSLQLSGDLAGARHHIASSIGMWRSLGVDENSKLPLALGLLADLEADGGRSAAARSLIVEALDVARQLPDKLQLVVTLNEMAFLESAEHHHDSSLKFAEEALHLAQALGAPTHALTAEQTMARARRLMGQAGEARELMLELMPKILAHGQPLWTLEFAEDYASVLSDLADYRPAVRLLGAAEASRERLGSRRDALQQAEQANPIAKTRIALSAELWDREYQYGRNITVEDALREATSEQTA